MSSRLKLMVLTRGVGNLANTAPTTPTLPALPLDPTNLVENTDYGVVKVQNGKLVLDMQDFDADLGRF